MPPLLAWPIVEELFLRLSLVNLIFVTLSHKSHECVLFCVDNSLNLRLLFLSLRITMCPRSSDQFYIVICYIKRVTTSLALSRYLYFVPALVSEFILNYFRVLLGGSIHFNLSSSSCEHSPVAELVQIREAEGFFWGGGGDIFGIP